MKKLLIILILVFCIQLSYSQTKLTNKVIATAGNFTSSSNTKLSWTLGDNLVDRLSSTSYILTPGFQQSWDLAVSINPIDDILSVETYPNPILDKLIIKFGDVEINSVRIDIHDITGNRLISRELDGQIYDRIEELDLSELKQGIYFMNLQSADSKLYRVIKLIKY